MSDEHKHPHPAPPPPSAQQAAPAEDAGSQALSEALRSSFIIVQIIMVVLVLAFLGSGFFTVGQTEKAIILRMGRPVGEGEAALLNPGAHWAMPKPIDEIVRIPASLVQDAQSSVGWMLTVEEQRQGAAPVDLGIGLDPATISYVLTSDTNIIHAVAVAHYHITDPIHFHFDFVDAPVFITNDLNNSLIFAASHFTVDDVLTRQRTAFREAVENRLNSLVNSQNLGISVDRVDVETAPPTHLLAKFNEVDTATQRRNTARAQAETYATIRLAGANADAAARINLAESERSGLVAMVGAMAKEFNEVRGGYERDPGFYKRIRQMTALQEVYTNAQEKILEPLENQHQLRLNLGREPQGPSANAANP
jgi:membrane protease subunit HflK